MILLTLSRGKGEETVRLQLPASPAEIGETFAFLDRISLDTTATAILDVSSNVPVLYRCLYDVDVEDSEQFQKLQKLAERTEALSPAKAAIFSGALDAECVWNLEGALTVADRLDEYTAHIHNHIIMNSVNFENGQKFHQSAREMQQAKEYSNQLCREYGLSFTESKADPFRIPAWKKRLCHTIKEAMENCATREEFIAFMAEYGYKVRWEPNQKYITYTTPENVRCRDNKLFDQTLLRSSMEAYFDMGGCEYLESRIDATEYGELLPTVDDAVCGLISILDAMNTGDNDRFHLETLHHSKQEIRRILERGGKIDRTVEYAVDDEDEEYEQYHGFSMRM